MAECTEKSLKELADELLNLTPESLAIRVINDSDVEWCLSELSDILAADVAPVVHGRWEDVPNQYISVAGKNGSYSGNVTSCSACEEVNPNAYKTNYCPNCGAKMDLEG